jgi:hypothetical protein
LRQPLGWLPTGQDSHSAIGEKDPFSTHQYADLSVLELDHFLLLTIYPACENQKEELPRLEDESHQIAITEIGANNRG